MARGRRHVTSQPGHKALHHLALTFSYSSDSSWLPTLLSAKQCLPASGRFTLLCWLPGMFFLEVMTPSSCHLSLTFSRRFLSGMNCTLVTPPQLLFRSRVFHFPHSTLWKMVLFTYFTCSLSGFSQENASSTKTRPCLSCSAYFQN